MTAKNVSCDEVVFGRLESLPFPDASFDAVLSLWVLEHLEESAQVFREIGRVLKPGGFFAFVTPNARSLLIAARRLVHQRVAESFVHRVYGREEEDVFPVRYRANTVGRLRGLAHAAGFTVAVLKENTDPSYTSFNAVTYVLSSWASQVPGPLFRPHIVGVFTKA